MAWITFNEAHTCTLPSTRPNGDGINVGDKWQCDVCSIVWIYCVDPNKPGSFWSQTAVTVEGES